MIDQKPAPVSQRLWPALRQRCPQCLEGPVFYGLLTMHQTCPVCDYVYEREPGYFTGAMYISYGLAVFSLIPTSLVLYLLRVPDLWIFVLMGLQLAVTSPLLVRYSRVFWLHLDHLIFAGRE